MVAVIVPSAAHVEVEPELFLVLFIAPLLFEEARNSNKRELWENKGSILSLAIGLVLVLVLSIGFTLHWLVPSIPLAAAFACGAALGPTDAAAVAALGSTVHLSRRQETLLSGESLINDASGVVSFQFAIAAAVTGAFSVVEAGATFAVLFFGGIIAGAAMGALARYSIKLVRRRGFENTTVNVIYEVFTPFVVFLAAEAIEVSGILAVVAAGLVMAEGHARLASASAVKHSIVSKSVWEVIVFLINGAIFVMLGMQLPQAMNPTLQSAGYSPWQLIAYVLLLTFILILVRFIWVSAMELVHKDPITLKRGYKQAGQSFKEALITTIAGPKGAVTLSIIFTIPFFLQDGSAFPMRNMILFLTAGVILCTLLVADIALPILAAQPNDDKQNQEEVLRAANIELYKRVISELQTKMREGSKPQYAPATRLTIARYRTRLNRERFAQGEKGKILASLVEEVLQVQQNKADKIQAQGAQSYSASAAAPYYIALRGIRSSVGYHSGAERVGGRFKTLKGNLALLWQRMTKRSEVGGAQDEKIYIDTCRFAIELENAAIEYLTEVKASDEKANPARTEAATVLIGEHRAALKSIEGRLECGKKLAEQAEVYETDALDTPYGISEQFRTAWKYANEVDSAALEIELDQIRHMHEEKLIDEAVARKMRENVYLLQMSLSEE